MCQTFTGKSNFLSGNSHGADFDHECYARTNIAYSRATDLTGNTHGIPGVSQVTTALLHGVCTLHTSHKESAGVWVDGCFSAGSNGVVASTAAFLTAMEPHELWNGPLPVCLVEHHQAETPSCLGVAELPMLWREAAHGPGSSGTLQRPPFWPCC